MEKLGDMLVYTSKTEKNWKELFLIINETEAIDSLGQISSLPLGDPQVGENEFVSWRLYTSLDSEWFEYFHTFCEELAEWERQVLSEINTGKSYVQKVLEN